MDEKLAQCALCDIPSRERFCRNPGTKGRGPANCPSLRFHKLADSVCEHALSEHCEVLRQAAIKEATGRTDREKGPEFVRPIKPRIVETVEFAKRMGYKRLGLLFCGGLHREAKIVHEILETNGFEVVSVMCKVGAIPKSVYGIRQEEQLNVFAAEESSCNPMLQAEVANAQQTEFNILLGLCVGHDLLAIKYLQAPTTVLAVKDRVTGHSPLVPIYQYDQYYKYLKKPL